MNMSNFDVFWICGNLVSFFLVYDFDLKRFGEIVIFEDFNEIKRI